MTRESPFCESDAEKTVFITKSVFDDLENVGCVTNWTI